MGDGRTSYIAGQFKVTDLEGRALINRVACGNVCSNPSVVPDGEDQTTISGEYFAGKNLGPSWVQLHPTTAENQGYKTVPT